MIYIISEHCTKYAEYSIPPLRFGPSMPKENIVFNRDLAMDRMWLESGPVRNIVDSETELQNAMIINEKCTEKLWNDYINAEV